jgi:glycine/D-amino acid oxidase-like deaminating enzyme
MTQHATVAWDGALDAVGARWATPHMEVGETEPVPAPAVDAMLERLTRHAFPEAGARAGSWAGIVGESCDNLPFFGPIPGRPREIACAGFGFWGLPVIWRAAAAIAAGLLGDASAEVPRTLSTGRFR